MNNDDLHSIKIENLIINIERYDEPAGPDSLC